MLTLKHGIVASSLIILDNLLKRSIGIVSMIILARVLSPQDFGLVAIAFLVLNFTQVVTHLGGQEYLMSQKTIDNTMLYSAWTLSLIIKGSIVVIMFLLSPFIADYYNDPRLTPIIITFGFVLLLEVTGNPMMFLRTKNLDYKALTVISLVTKVTSTLVVVYVAVVYETYWALVIGHLIRASMFNVASYIIDPYLPKITLKNVKPQWNFTKWIMPNSLLGFFKNQIDVIFVSSTFDKASLGGYNSMKYYALIPNEAVINPALTPMLAQFSGFKDNIEHLKNQFGLSITFILTITAAVVSLIYLQAENIVAILLGEKWVPYAFVFSIFSLLTISHNLTNIVNNLIYLKGKVRLITLYSLISMVAYVLLFALYDFESIYELAEIKIWIDITISLLAFFYTFTALINLKFMMRILLVNMPIMLISLISIFVSNTLYISHENLFLELFANSAIFSFSYSTLFLLLMFSLEKTVYEYGYIKNKVFAATLTKIATKLKILKR